MNYHNITTDDMLNGEGLRTVLWVSGCTIDCPECQNPQTHDFDSGIPFTEDTMQELLYHLSEPYIDGLTLSGGHPLERENIPTVKQIISRVKEQYPDKSIWIYTGLTWEEIITTIVLECKNDWTMDSDLKYIIENTDVLVDGEYVNSLRDVSLPYKGSSNQRVIDVQRSLKTRDIVLKY